MKKIVIPSIIAVVILAGAVVFGLRATAQEPPFENLYQQGFAGYTSDEGEVLTTDYVSSKKISVHSGETIWFGPCEPTQYFQMVGFAADGTAVTDKIRGKELTVSDRFENGMVVYQYIVPEGVKSLIFSAPGAVKEVYAVAKTEISNINWRAYWNMKGMDTADIVGESSYYEVAAGDKLYFGAVTKASALESGIYDESGSKTGSISEKDLVLVESFGGDFGIYCYTVPEKNTPTYVHVVYDGNYEQYYTCIKKKAGDAASAETIVESFITAFGVPRPVSTTVSALSGKSALFVGDSITYGARDRAKIYGSGGWAGRIGYYCGMDVTNNGVSGACISTSRINTSGEDHYIYNNLVAANGKKYDFIIMHGMFNDASDKVALGTPQGKASFDPNKADVTTFAGGLELLFYTAKQQHPEAILGYIVNFKTERTVEDAPFAAMAISICKDWGIRYLDLYNRADFSVEFDDGLHPSSAGYDSMYCNVANWMASLANGAAEESYQTGSKVKVMSYNVYWDAVDKVSDEYTIPDRVSKIQNLIKTENPDVLLLQEVGAKWAYGIPAFADANGYSCYGYSHYSANSVDKSGSDDQFTPILWKTDKYDLTDSGHFWLSSTPDKAASASWADGTTSKYPRCINWVVLKDKTTNAQFLVMNVHMDPNDEKVRNLSSRLLAEQLSKLRSSHGNPAAIVGGDWNIALNSTAYSTMVSNGFRDVRLSAADTTTSGSYNAWNRTSGYSLGDYLFMAEGMNAGIYQVVNDWDTASGLHLSDHSPIQAEIAY